VSQLKKQCTASTQEDGRLAVNAPGHRARAKDAGSRIPRRTG
jgi:hypothetical protein